MARPDTWERRFGWDLRGKAQGAQEWRQDERHLVIVPLAPEGSVTTRSERVKTSALATAYDEGAARVPAGLRACSDRSLPGLETAIAGPETTTSSFLVQMMLV